MTQHLRRLDPKDMLWWWNLPPKRKLALLAIAKDNLEALNMLLNELTDDVFEELFAEVAKNRGLE